MGVLEILGSHILIWNLKEETMRILPHPKHSRAFLSVMLYISLNFAYHNFSCDSEPKMIWGCRICTFVKSPRGLEFGPCVIWGVGSWDPLARQKWRQIWKRCLCWRRLHNIDPALQYLHKTAQYAEWGGYNICTCPYLCTYNHMLDSRRERRDLAGDKSSDERIWVAECCRVVYWRGTKDIDPAQGYRPTRVVYWRGHKDIEENLHLASTHCRWPTSRWDEIFL